MGLRIGFVAYSTLRADLLAPRSCTTTYTALFPRLREITGEPVHWMPLKHLQEGCETPPATATPEEVLAHQSCYHYGASLKPIITHINRLPIRGRWEASETTPFDWSSLQYGIPEVDVVIVESTGQIGGAHAIDFTLRALWRKNPKLGIVVFDQDQCASTTFAKMKKWFPNYKERTVVVGNYLGRSKRWHSQAPALAPNFHWSRMDPSPQGEGIAYIGNDYQRRDAMARLIGGPNCYWMGTLRPRQPGDTYTGLKGMTSEDFLAVLQTAGCQHLGPYSPSPAIPSIEHCYNRFAAGMCFFRDDCYHPVWHFSARSTEVARAGKFAFWDKEHALSLPLGGEFAQVSNAAEANHKLLLLKQHPDYWRQMIDYQWQALCHYTTVERFVLSYYYPALALSQGPVQEGYELNLYKDLMTASGLMPWGVG